MKNIKNLVTHNGKFHLDEVFGYAILSFLFPKAKLIRTRDEKLLSKHKNDNESILFDIGKELNLEKNLLDHHLLNDELIVSRISKEELNLKFVRWSYFKELIAQDTMKFNSLKEKNDFLNKHLRDGILQEQKELTSLENYYRDYLENDITLLSNLSKSSISMVKSKIIFTKLFLYRKYSSFGLIWLKYGKEFLRKFFKTSFIGKNEEVLEQLFKTVDYRIVTQIDLDDNGITTYEFDEENYNSLSAIVSLSNARDVNDDKLQLKNFEEVSITLFNYLKNFLNNESYKIEDYYSIQSEYKNGEKIQIFSKYYKGLDKFINNCEKENEITKFIVFNNGDGKYRVKSLLASTFNSKYLLPNDWLTNPPKGCNFIHPALFISEFEDLDSVISALTKII